MTLYVISSIRRSKFFLQNKELMIKDNSIEFIKGRIIKSFHNGKHNNHVSILSKDKDFLDFLIEKNIDISKDVK